MKTNAKAKYTVWVGGIPDVENVELSKALRVLKYWISLGYDDAVIEMSIKG